MPIEITTEHRQQLSEILNQEITPPLVRRINDAYGEQLGGLILASAVHQQKAVSQLGPGTWWVTRESLQKATAWQVAKLKASWFERNQPIFDFCCGVGGDSRWLSTSASTIAVDNDPLICAAAKANLMDQDVTIQCADVTEIAVAGDAFVHIDPDRRSDQRRHTNADYFRPSWDFVAKLIESTNGGVIKLAPGTDLPDCEAEDAALHRTWISLRGSVREQSVVYGRLLDSIAPQQQLPARSAIVVHSDATYCRYIPSIPIQSSVNSQPKALGWMVDPDAAIRAAGLTETFASEFGISAIGHPSGFLTTNEIGDQVQRLGVAEPVVWSGSADDRKIRRELRARNAYPKKIKVRGASHDPNVLTSRYRKCGDNPVSLWIGRHGKKVYAVMTDPEHQAAIRG